MKILAWNIQHGGGTRLARIVEEVSAFDADVIALTEFREYLRLDPQGSLAPAVKQIIPEIEKAIAQANEKQP